jgi:hypothetical protein
MITATTPRLLGALYLLFMPFSLPARQPSKHHYKWWSRFGEDRPGMRFIVLHYFTKYLKREVDICIICRKRGPSLLVNFWPDATRRVVDRELLRSDRNPQKEALRSSGAQLIQFIMKKGLAADESTPLPIDKPDSSALLDRVMETCRGPICVPANRYIGAC